MIGLPVIRNDVTGVITDKIIPHAIPAPSAAMIRHALMIGPVMYTLVFLKNWLTIQIASNTAVVVDLFRCDFHKSSFVFRRKMRARWRAEDFPPLFCTIFATIIVQHL